MLELNYLIDMISKEKLDTMSGKQKLAYKYCLCSIFINMISGAHYTKVQEISIVKANQITKLPRKHTDFTGLSLELSKIINASFEEKGFLKPYNDEMINKVISFFRLRLKEVKEEGISLIQAKEFSSFLDPKVFCGYPFIGEHHWFEFTLHRHLTLTIPEGVIFSDLKVHWNTFIELWDKLQTSREVIFTREDEFDFYSKEESRENMYKLVATYRTLIILGVSFVEAYLYNLFYCIKQVNFPEKYQVEEVLEYKKIEDKQIVKQVIYPLFPEVKEKVDNYFEKYKETIKYRDRYIHASAFMDQSDNTSELEPLLQFDLIILLRSLQNSIDFVKGIDSQLPSNLQILFWWYDGEINFHELKKLQLTNSASLLNRSKYHNV